MNEMQKLAEDLSAAGNVAAATIVAGLRAPRETMRMTHPGQNAYGGNAWNGWLIARVVAEIRASNVSREDGGAIAMAINELREDEEQS